MKQPELKLGRRVIAWNDNDSTEHRGVFMYNDNSGYMENWVLLDGDYPAGPFENVRIDFTAPPMNGDEVEGLHYTDKWVGKARYIGEKLDGSHMIEVMGLELAMIVSKVRHPQPSKRERVEDVLDAFRDSKLWKHEAFVEIDKIYKKDL